RIAADAPDGRSAEHATPVPTETNAAAPAATDAELRPMVYLPRKDRASERPVATAEQDFPDAPPRIYLPQKDGVPDCGSPRTDTNAIERFPKEPNGPAPPRAC